MFPKGYRLYHNGDPQALWRGYAEGDSLYLVYEATLPLGDTAEQINEIYHIHNDHGRPRRHDIRSLSVGDIVEIRYERVGGDFYACESSGWTEIDPPDESHIALALRRPVPVEQPGVTASPEEASNRVPAVLEEAAASPIDALYESICAEIKGWGSRAKVGRGTLYGVPCLILTRQGVVPHEICDHDGWNACKHLFLDARPTPPAVEPIDGIVEYTP